MTIYLNDKTIELPSSLAEITIGQRIAFNQQHGAELNAMLETIAKIQDDFDKDQTMIQFNLEKMIRVFAFLSGADVEAIRESEFLDVVSVVYYATLEALFRDSYEPELKTEFSFKDEEWTLSEPQLKNGSTMSFGEFIDAKQLVKDMIDNEVGKWEVVHHLACIYLRKKGEPYKEEFLYEDSERIKLFQNLPMDIAAQVDFFLSGTMNFSTSILKSFERAALRDQEKMFVNTSIYMAGLISSNQSQPQKCSTFRGLGKIASIACGRQN